MEIWRYCPVGLSFLLVHLSYEQYVCVHVNVQSVFPSSLGVLICAGQELYREPLWRNVACSKVVIPFVTPSSPPFPLSIITSLLVHICLHS